MKIQHAKTYQGQDRTASQGNSTKHIKKELIPNLPNLLQKNKRMGHSQIHSTGSPLP